jgi:hypothetical protein
MSADGPSEQVKNKGTALLWNLTAYKKHYNQYIHTYIGPVSMFLSSDQKPYTQKVKFARHT